MDLEPGTSSVVNDGIPPSDHDPIKLAQSTDRALILERHDAVLPEQKTKMNSEAEADWVAKFGSISLKRADQASGPPAPVQLIPANCVDISTLTQNPNKVLHGKYFLCRTIAPSFRFCAIEAIVEDPIGQQGIRVSLYNAFSLDKCSYENLLEELPVGQILAVKNPCFKSKDSWIKERNGEFYLKCDQPEEVVTISGSIAEKLFPDVKWEGEIPEKWQKFIQSTPKTLIEWRNQGNKEFLGQKYEKAIQSYTEGLNLKDGAGGDTSERITCDMLSNRAAAYLSLQCFQNALEDVDKLLEIDPTHFKGLYRKGKALLGLQRFQDAVQFVEQSSLASDSENQKLFMELLELAGNLLKQQKTGEYDFLKLHKAGDVHHNDCAEFMGPVKLQNVSGSRSGLGFVATQHIQTGQLISATKAFQIVFPVQELGPSPDPNLVYQELIEGIVQKLTLDPSLCRTFYQLYAGKDFPIFDAEKDPLVVDLKRIVAIRRHNTRMGGTPNYDKLFPYHLYRPEKPIGIWTFSSLINRSCWDVNVTTVVFGDMLFVRAIKEIPIGAEIVTSSIDITKLYEERQDSLKTQELDCDCSLCQIDRDDSKEGKKRMELLKRIDKEQQERNYGYEIRMEKMVNKIWDLDKRGRRPNLKFNPSLIEPLLQMGQFFHQSGNYKKTVDVMIKRYALATDSPLKPWAVECCFQLINVHLKMDGNVEEAKKWAETLRNELMTEYGTLDLVHLIHQGMLDLMAKYNIFLQ